jgi:phosphoribosylglycinamide formyltransferase-1
MGLKIAVLISGGGTNLQSIIDNVENGVINGEIKLVISNKSNAYGLERAKEHNIPAFFIEKENRNGKILEMLDVENIDLVILAGYLKILSSEIIKKYNKRIINIHPSLIPKYCGKGYYGEKVHKAVIENKEKYSGATVHFVDEGIDTGKILMQEKLEINENDDYKSLAKKILKIEHKILVKVVAEISKGDYNFESIN